MITLALVLSPNAHACSPPVAARPPETCPPFRRADIVSRGRLYATGELPLGDPLIFQVTDNAWDEWSTSLHVTRYDETEVPHTVSRVGDLALVWVDAPPGTTVYVTSVRVHPGGASDGGTQGFDVVDPLPADVDAPTWAEGPGYADSTHPCISGPVDALSLGTTEPLALALVRAPGTGWSGVVAQWPETPERFEVLLESHWPRCDGHVPTAADALEVTLFDLAGNVSDPVTLDALAPPADPGTPVADTASGCTTTGVGSSFAGVLALIGVRRRAR